MKIKRMGLRAAVLASSLALTIGAGVGSANADSHGRGGGGILSGNDIHVPVTAPIDVCGNGVAIIGLAFGQCQGGAAVFGRSASGSDGHVRARSRGIGSGNHVSVPVNAPVNACGNAVSALGGVSAAQCEGGAVAPPAGTRTAGHRRARGGGILSGNDIHVPVTAPIDVCGNAVAVIGGALAQCEGGAAVIGGSHDGTGSMPPYVAGSAPSTTGVASLPKLPELPLVPGLGS